MGAAPERLRAVVRGRVQGVGFRPFVHGLAQRHGLGGWVQNDGGGVTLEIEGPDCAGFLADLVRRAPPLARIDRVTSQPVGCEGGTGFVIRPSEAAPAECAGIGPDAAVCADCLEEMCDPSSRRWRYPFTNCTQCGPRFTIARGLPYDRPLTAMAGFALCPGCAREYGDPADRRHHAQPIACPACGPRLDLEPRDVLAAVRAGEIVALKGLGGFHLVGDAHNAAAVAALRERKGREAKPLAVMVANLASARRLARIDADDAALLVDAARPIVLARSRGRLPAVVSGGLSTIGLMLPSTPIHHLLFHSAVGEPAGTAWLETPIETALVMTSANPAGEPLVIDEAEAERRLAGIADRIVGHDRPIVTRADDSVVRVVAGAAMLVRRSRGYVPDAIALAETGPPVLAVGALLKTTACLARGKEALLSQHVGNLQNAATFRFLDEAVRHLQRLLRSRPEAVACDLHPDYPSSRFARDWGVPVMPIQHHAAHLAAVAAEHGIGGRLVGLVLDGFGLGDDGTLWGGELLCLTGSEAHRLGHLAALPLPGGDAAARAPWRIAAAILHELGRGEAIAARFRRPEAAPLAALLAAGHRAPRTTACGRLFDAAAALLGVRLENRFEGEAAMALEDLCRRPTVMPGGWRLVDGVLDLRPLLARLVDLEPQAGADLFHGTLADGLAALALQTELAGGRLALAGGCAVNRPLVHALGERLAAQGITLLLPRAVPAGDGGLALGQAFLARRLLERG